jgi:hypothetical protein
MAAIKQILRAIPGRTKWRSTPADTEAFSIDFRFAMTSLFAAARDLVAWISEWMQ